MEEILNGLLELRENLFGMVKVLADVRQSLIDEGFDEESANRIVAGMVDSNKKEG